MSNPKTLFRAFAVVALVLGAFLAPTPAGAEINMADSVDWMTADADLVVRGRVTAAQGTPGQGQVTWYDVTLKVDETLKGKALPEVRFVMRHLYGDSPAQWQRDRTELLAYLVRGVRRAKEDARFGRAPYALRVGVREEGELVRLTGPRTGRVFTMDYQVVTGRGPILAAARAATRTTGARGRHPLDLPASSPAYKALWGGSAVWLYVPLDGRLERLAASWIGAKELYRRLEGVKVLAHFKSAANIRRLRGLLGDRDYWTETTGQPGAPRTRVYAVREAAYKALTAWQVSVPRPVIRVPAP